jgi:hypothetical protein
VAQAEECDKREDEQLQDKTGYEIPDELKIKEKRLAKIREAKEALEERENELNPGKKVDEKKQMGAALLKRRQQSCDSQEFFELLLKY